MNYGEKNLSIKMFCKDEKLSDSKGFYINLCLKGNRDDEEKRPYINSSE